MNKPTDDLIPPLDPEGTRISAGVWRLFAETLGQGILLPFRLIWAMLQNNRRKRDMLARIQSSSGYLPPSVKESTDAAENSHSAQ